MKYDKKEHVYMVQNKIKVRIVLPDPLNQCCAGKTIPYYDTITCCSASLQVNTDSLDTLPNRPV